MMRKPQSLLGNEFKLGWFENMVCNICKKKINKEYGVLAINKSDPLKNITCYECAVLYRKIYRLEFMK